MKKKEEELESQIKVVYMNYLQIQYPYCIYEPRGVYSIIDTTKDIIDTIKLPKTWKRYLPVLFGVFWMALCGYWNSVFQVLAQERYTQWLMMHPEVPRRLVLPDFFFKVLPYFKQSWVCDIYIGIFVIFTNIRFLLTPYRSCVIRRYFFLQGTIFLIRSFSIFFTIMPDPSLSTSNVKYNPFIEGFLIMFGIHKTSYDCMFSGHTANIVLCACMWYQYSDSAPIFKLDCLNSWPINSPTGYPLRFTITKAIGWIVCIGGILLFCVTHLHYFVDIYIGCIVAFLLFKLYHNYILTIYTRNNIFNAFLRWFEQDAPDIPREVLPIYNSHFE
ncbi:sphingomyelin synthetase, putative [Entamoeba histolytica HM-3:IMSS]|uniref:Sphingomyelin synthase-like domain-containing protein n=5 Tax=Entamoeba histolytica TaxID=5759 RepID=C4M364_ENTH1|nr:hypothetical protein EHI_086090 [Entamoeba histolytica HM-1:IMSS]EAL47701.1 hypothetical protein EHI_086090 [Entamoeba histolytica HM-1:IMSS]EMD46309.1 sphingomyelin synthetase, putative [Entamoeba histolytica KU27]EMS15257.1 sphingomyelin synthetase, putative [Entamoeba histolytica HM-3:IMSS]ENY61262.1 sphingomyelin synthetase, putative [Entamoeba histolytica HM-1:IMSS-A]|eukprot:XP_653087.1 hypothetical protein EHI_086090 [Entamoeba histolytica HM-1:IMSS]